MLKMILKSIFLFVYVSVSCANFVTYNDCSGTASSNSNTTSFTNYMDYTGSTSGLLKNDATGSTTGMPTVTFTIPANTAIQPVLALDFGVNPYSGTDAYAIFNGKVDFSGTIIQYSSSIGWFVEIKFTNLNPSKKYTFVGSAFRNSENSTRITQCTLQGADAFTNNSSNGVVLKSGAVTKFLAANNSNEGYVVRWDDIEPGADGEFSIYTVSASSTDRRAYPLHGFMLQEIDVSVNTPPVVDAGPDQMIHLPKEYLTLTGSVSDDGWGDPMGYLESTWSQVSGPATVEFVTDIHQPQVTAHFPAAGDYELQLSATDGLLNASDVVMITAADPICPVGDMDADCIVGFSDLVQLAIAWLEDTEPSPSDLNGDAIVDMGELSLLSQSWLDNWTGSLQVTLSPAQVVTAGAQWRVDGGSWQSSGATVSSLPEGSHDVEYSVAANWSAPGTQTVQVARQQTTTATGQYSTSPQTIAISEFMATNSYIPFVNSMNIYTRYSWKTAENVNPDWIELHNTGTEALNLAGWYLTDDPDNKTKWRFPSTMGSQLILNPGQYIIVFASNKEQTLFPANYPYVDYDGALHTSFELSGNGEYLAVVAPDGVTVSQEYNDYPEQYPFMSYGISQDETIGYLTPTPGTRVNNKWTGGANLSASPGKVTDTQFSHDRGLYESAFGVTISCDTVGAEIHYTLDGTEPKSAVGSGTLLYGGPIPVSTTTCLRAKAFKAGLLSSNIDTQTYLFLDSVVTQVKPADSRYVTSWGGYSADYEMENNTTDIKLVAGDAGYTVEQARAVIKTALTKIPTLSVVTEPDYLFASTLGIYTNTINSGDLWERPASAEYFGGDPNEIFQIDCGLRISGGATGSRFPDKTAKHSLSLRFRGGYGDARLKTGIFKQTSVNEFDTLQLRSVYNNSWLHADSGQRSRCTMIHDQFARDSLIAMGQKNAGDGTFVHLYLNGLYWGVYNLHERPEASHYAAYYGGDSDFYDALNGGAAVDGSNARWNTLTQTVTAAPSQANWEAIVALLDVANYIDWTIIEHYCYNQDLKSDGNWRAAGGGVFSAPWQFYAWDSERTLENGNAGTPLTSSDENLPFFLGYLKNYAEFRIQFADRLYKHFRNQGALTYTRASARLNLRKAELIDAIIAESARWGDYRRDVRSGGSGILYTKNGHWLTAVLNIDGYLLAKETNAITHFKNYSPSLYPAIEPPVFKINTVQQSGGDVAIPCTFDMTNTNGVGQIYYTLDGTDPRAYWTENVSGTATLYNGTPIGLNKSVTVKARVKNSSTWSALHEATYVDEQISGSLRVTELMYHPVDPNLEFIELKNIGAEAINLNRVQFTNGITHTFGDVSVATGGFVLLVKNETLFEAHYTSLPVGVQVIQWIEGVLDNAGEKITIKDALGRIIQSFGYKDSWYLLTDGDGFSLSIFDPLNSDLTLWDQKAGWRTSAVSGGSPGADEAGLAPDSIIINELLAHSHDTLLDWIELHNTTAQPISIGGWFLSDSNTDYTKYAIPDDTPEIPAGGYAVFYEDLHFGTAFALSENGETLYLTSGVGGQITGYQTSQSFDASERGVSLGRHVKSDGDMDFIAMSSLTISTANAAPAVGPIVISEIQYNPAAANTGDEYIELHNISGQAVALQDWVETETAPGVFENQLVSWMFTDGIDFTFPAGTQIGVGKFLIIAKNPAAFNAYYTGLPSGTQVLGPFENGTSLSNGGEKVRFCRPGEQPFGQPRSWIRVDQVTYDDVLPWPTTPDGDGKTLQRINHWAYGNDPANWTAANSAPGQ
jgi:hypothetical protein